MSRIFLRSWHHFRTKFLIAALLLVNIGAFAQSITISGTVTAKEDNSPLPGANILAKKLNIGAVSDFDGNYSITVPKGTTLEFSYEGLLPRNVKADSKVINVSLEPNPVSLEETVVIGYGVQKKKEVTGAVAQVKAEEIENIVTSDISTALQGQVAGVSVTANNGEPGESSGILIRGVSSLSGSNDPLFVVDGVPQAGDPGLNPNEIETIDVLKDAASASIYGTRAASGVILITTKKGTIGKAKVTVDITSGLQGITREASLLNTEEQIFFDLNQQQTNRGNISQARNNRFSLLNDTNLRDIVQNDNALQSRYNVNISGGTKDLRYNLTLGYFDEEGIIINSRLKRYNLRSNTQIEKNNWSFNNSFGFTVDDRIRPSFFLINLAQSFQPFRSADVIGSQTATVGDNEDFALESVIENIGTKRDVGRYRFDASSNIGYKFNDALSFKTLISGVITTNFERQSRPVFQIFRRGQPTRDAFDDFVFEQRVRRVLINWNASLNYNKSFGKHSITGLALVSVEEDTETSIGALQRGQIFPGLRQNLASTSIGAANTSFGQLNSETPFINQDLKIRRIGTIGRLQYNYDQKYLLSLSTRVDASTQFSSNNQYAVFPSVSAAWNISDEKFWSNIKPVVNSFKFRASFGTTGNDRFQPNSSESFVKARLDNALGNRLNAGFAQSKFGNPDLKWEVTREFNLGADINLFKNKIQLTADYYKSDKEDLLIDLPNTPSAVGISIFEPAIGGDRLSTVNVGDLTNEGIELSARFKPSIGKAYFNIALTYTQNKSIVENIGNGSQFRLFNQTIIFGDASSRATGLLINREPGSFLVFKTDGILKTQTEVDAYNQRFNENARIGDLKYVDTNNNRILREDTDRIYGGSGLPDFETSLNVSMTYKNFYVATNWFASVGNEVLNAGRANSLSIGRNRDLLFQHLDGINNNTPIPTFRGPARNSISENFRGDVDRFVEDGSFLRLRNIFLSYSLPKDAIKGLGLSKLSIYTSAQNVLTITDYTGFDPETGGNSIERKGLDRANFPISARYNLGFKLEF